MLVLMVLITALLYDDEQTYMYLVRQDRSAWTWELDLRPAHEKW